MGEQPVEADAVGVAHVALVHREGEAGCAGGDAGAVVAEADPPAEVDAAAGADAVAIAVGDLQRGVQADQVRIQADVLAGVVRVAARRRMVDAAVLVEADRAAAGIDPQGEHPVRRADPGGIGGGGADDHAADQVQVDRRAAAGQAGIGALPAGQLQRIAELHVAGAVGAVLPIGVEGAGEVGAGAVMAPAEGLCVAGLQAGQLAGKRQAGARHVVDDADVQPAAGLGAIAVGDAEADLEVEAVFHVVQRMIQRFQQGQLVGAAVEVGEAQGEYRGVAGHAGQGAAVGAQRVGQRHAAGGQRRQAVEAPAEAAGAVRAEVVVQAAADAGAFAGQRLQLQVAVTARQAAGQAILAEQRGGKSRARDAIDRRRRGRWRRRWLDGRLDHRRLYRGLHRRFYRWLHRRLGQCGDFRQRRLEHLATREQRAAFRWRGGKTDIRRQRAADFAEQYEGMAAASLGAGRRRAGGSGIGVLGRVDAGGDGRLQGLHVAEVLLRRLGRRLAVAVVPGMGGGLDLAGEVQRTVAAEGDFPAPGDRDRHRAVGAGDQPFADIQSVALLQRPARSIGSLGEDLADYLADDTQ
ncbi:hypothetical protein D9M69_296880 [compost metagenome]